MPVSGAITSGQYRVISQKCNCSRRPFDAVSSTRPHGRAKNARNPVRVIGVRTNGLLGSFMRRQLAVILAVPLLSAAQEAPIIKVNTQLVEVNVIVRAKNGPVADLTKDDFAIFDRGKKRDIAVFSVSSVHALRKPGAPLAPNSFTNRLERREETPTTVTVVLLDGLNTPFTDQAYARTEVIKFLSQIGPQDRVAVYSLGMTLRVLQDFTGDTQRLMRAIRRHRGELAADTGTVEYKAADTGDAELDAWLDESRAAFVDTVFIERVRRTMDALVAIAGYIGQMPGRKNLIWVSGSFPFTMNLELAFNMNGPARERRSFESEVSRAVLALNSANIAVYPVDARGLIPPVEYSAARGLMTRRQARMPPQPTSNTIVGMDTMEVLASRTGGKAFYNTNDINGAIRKAVDDSEVTYTLAFYADSEADSKFHELKVQVKRPGLDIRHRKGYVAAPPTSANQQSREARIRAALWSPLEQGSIGLSAELTTVDQPKPGSHGVMLRINPEEVSFTEKDGKWTGQLEVVIARKSGDGRDLGSRTETVRMNLAPAVYEQLQRQGLLLRRIVEPEDNLDQIRIVVLDDSTGRVGSLAVPVKK